MSVYFFICSGCGHKGYGNKEMHVCKDRTEPDEFKTSTSSNEPPAELMEKLTKLQENFPEGFVIFLPPQKENSTWIGVFRFNPKRRLLIEAIYKTITEGKMMGGHQN